VTVLQKEQKGEPRTLAEVQGAIDDLTAAAALFAWLGQREPGESSSKRALPYG
jgi:hypothetical protein